MKNKSYESESILKNIVIGIILVVAVFAAWVAYPFSRGSS